MILRPHSRVAITLVEIVIAMAIFSVVLFGGYRSMQAYAGRASENLSTQLLLQMEARRALLTMTTNLQQGLELVLPRPGATLPYVTYRDFVNNLRVIYLEKDESLSAREQQTLYQAVEKVIDPADGTKTTTKILMRYVTELRFTAHHQGAVVVTCSLLGGRGRFSLVNFIRLRNTGAADFR
jgi:prepilin-type N-terminal cleavage/methylation domain-containing protein